MRFLGIGLVFFALAASAGARVPPDDPVQQPAAVFWTDGPGPDVPTVPAETPKFDMCKPHPGIEVKLPAWCRVGHP